MQNFKSIAISVAKVQKYCNTYCKISKYCKFQKVLQYFTILLKPHFDLELNLLSSLCLLKYFEICIMKTFEIRPLVKCSQPMLLLVKWWLVIVVGVLLFVVWF